MNTFSQIQWPPLTRGVKILMGIYFAVFLIHPLLSGSLGISDFIISSFYLSNEGVFGYFKVWQPLTYQVLHNDFFHFAFNMFALYLFGAEVERRVGLKAFFKYMAGCGMGAATIGILWQIVVSLVSGQTLLSPVATVGASGAISGLISAYSLFNWERSTRLFGVVDMKGKWFIPLVVALDLTRLVSGDNIAFAHHLGGLITGALIVIVVYQPLQLINRVKLWRLKRKFRVMDGPRLRDPDDKGPTLH